VGRRDDPRFSTFLLIDRLKADRVANLRQACELLTGEMVKRVDPLSGVLRQVEPVEPAMDGRLVRLEQFGDRHFLLGQRLLAGELPAVLLGQLFQRSPEMDALAVGDAATTWVVSGLRIGPASGCMR
jgi:hypothetical protein